MTRIAISTPAGALLVALGCSSPALVTEGAPKVDALHEEGESTQEGGVRIGGVELDWTHPDAAVNELRRRAEGDLGSLEALTRLYFLLGQDEDAFRSAQEVRRRGGDLPAQLIVGLDARLAAACGQSPVHSTHASVSSLIVGNARTSTGDRVRIGPAVRVDAGPAGARAVEPTVGLAAGDPLTAIAGWHDHRRNPAWRLGVSLSEDGGKAWSDALLRPPPPHDTWILEGDPMFATDPRTGISWIGGVSTAEGVFVARKMPGATTLEPTVMAHLGIADKGLMAAGPAPGQPDSTRVYCSFNGGLLASSDLGTTWSYLPWSSIPINRQPIVTPDGHLHITSWDRGDLHLLHQSFDGGQTLVAPNGVIATRMLTWPSNSSAMTPGEFRTWPFPGFDFAPDDGRLYFVYPDVSSIEPNGFNVDLYFTSSGDQGQTWSTPIIVNGDSAIPGDQFMPWLDVDADGRLHLMYSDTRRTAQDDTDVAGLVDVYYSVSDDRGASWREVRLTDQPADSSLIPAPSLNGQFMGDYQGLATAGHRTLVIYPHTLGGDGDIYVQEIIDGPATDFCMGVVCPCANDDLTAGCGNVGFDADVSTGAQLSARGSDVALGGGLRMEVDGIVPGSFAGLYAARDTQRLPMGNGLSCLGGSSLQLVGLDRADSSGSTAFLPASAPVAPIAGETWHYQAIYRDVGGACASAVNWSNGVTVRWY